MRQVILYPGEDGCWVAECPSLPGCVSQGKTKEKTLLTILEKQYRVILQHLRKMDCLFPKERFDTLLVAV